VAGKPPRLGEGAPEQELDLRVRAAQFVGGPSRQGIVNGRIEPE
jgi:hypothetical protein